MNATQRPNTKLAVTPRLNKAAELRRQNEALTLALDLKRNQGKRIMTLASRVRSG